MQLNRLTAGLSPHAVKGAFVLAAAGVLVLVFAIVPYLWAASLREEADLLRAELDLLQARLTARADSGRTMLGQDDNVARMFLPASTEGMTLASFQERVGEVAASSGLSVLRMQPLPTDEVGGLSPFRLAVDGSGSLEQVQAFLIEVESMLPIVIVTGFDIQPRAATQGGEAPSFPSEDLAVSLRLEAYAWKAKP
jgi:hypothetical protein